MNVFIYYKLVLLLMTDTLVSVAITKLIIRNPRIICLVAIFYYECYLNWSGLWHARDYSWSSGKGKKKKQTMKNREIVQMLFPISQEWRLVVVYVSLVRARATRNCEDVGGCAKSETLGSSRGAKRKGGQGMMGKRLWRWRKRAETREGSLRSFDNDSRSVDEKVMSTTKRSCGSLNHPGTHVAYGITNETTPDRRSDRSNAVWSINDRKLKPRSSNNHLGNPGFNSKCILNFGLRN